MTETTLSNQTLQDPRDLLSPRRETFLARYPRKWKLAATGAVLVIGAGLWLILGLHGTGNGAKDLAEAGHNEGIDDHEASSPTLTPEKLFPELPEKMKAEQPLSSAEMEAIAQNDTDDPSRRLTPAPDPEIVEGDGKDGYLPTIGKDGRHPWQVYARPFDDLDKRPRIAIVITGLGTSRVATDSAIQRLPAQITLAFDPTSPLVSSWLTRARDDGHETLLSLPMEPFDYPRSDPGPNTLLSNISTDDNLLRLQSLLRRGVGYIGVMISGRSRIALEEPKMHPLLGEIKKRGLLIFDSQNESKSLVRDHAKEMQVPFVTNTQQIDVMLTPEGIDAALGYLEKSARLTGRAIGIATSTPLTLDRLDRWRSTLASRGIALAPISSMVR